MNHQIPVNMRSYKNILDKQSFVDTYNAYRDIRVDVAQKCGTDLRGYPCGTLPVELQRKLSLNRYGKIIEFEFTHWEQLTAGEYCNDLYSHPDCKNALDQFRTTSDTFRQTLRSRTAQFDKFDTCIKDYLHCAQTDNSNANKNLMHGYLTERLSVLDINKLYDDTLNRLKTFDNEDATNYKLAFITQSRTHEIQTSILQGGKTLEQLSSRFKKTIFNIARDQEPLTLEDINNFASRILISSECYAFFEYMLGIYSNDATKLLEDAKNGNINQESLMYHFLAHCQKSKLYISPLAYGNIVNIAKYLLGIAPRDDEVDLRMIDEIGSHNTIEIIGDLIISGTIVIKDRPNIEGSTDN